VKPDASKIGPTVLAYLLFDREGDIEEMATGSTGQTELSPSRLGQLELALPSAEDAAELEQILAAFEDRAASLQAENNHLVSLRDTLLPGLLSGRIRVPEASGVVS
jgi:type I restriction enzyme S subunit